jgi:hypothetical protein
MTTYQSQSTRVRQLFSTLAAVTASNPVLLEGEKWNEKDATTGRATGRTKTGDGVVSGTAPNQTITGTVFNDLPFDPGGSGGGATNLSIANRTAAGLTIASDTGTDADAPVATTTLAGLQSAADKTKLDSITVNSALEIRIYVRNNSGTSIPKGAPCYQTGSSGTTITVALADASSETTASQTLGLAENVIANNSFGHLKAVGELTGIDTSSLVEGEIVWLSETTGALTTTRPTQPAHGVVCGYCAKQGSGTSGIVYVKINNGLELSELHDVLITSATPGQGLRLGSDGLWRNHAFTAADVAADAAGTAAAAVAAHVAAADPHPTYTTAIEAAAAAPVQSVALTPPTGWSSSTANTGGSVTLSLALPTGYSLPSDASQANWNTAYSERLRWDGGSTGLNTTTARASLELGSAAQRDAGTAPGNVPVLDGSGLVPSALLTDVIVIPVGDETTALTAGTNKVKFRMPFSATLLAVRDGVNIAPTGSPLIVDINEAGTSVLGTKLSIDATETSSTTAASAATIIDSSLADDAEISIDIDQVGSTVAGAGLKVYLFVRRA